MAEATQYPRVNGEMLKSMKGANVCLLGKLSKTSPDQTSFELVSPDNRLITVKLKSPIRDQLSDYLEVYGSVDERGNIHCDNYCIFSEMSGNFDLELYNESIQMTQQLQKHYPQEEN